MGSDCAKWVLAAAPVLCTFFASKGALHFFQLESYQFPGYFHTLRRNKVRALLPGLIATITQIALCYAYDRIFMATENDLAMILGAVLVVLISAGIGLALSRYFAPAKAKKKLVFTGRVKRLLVVYFIVLSLISFGLASFSPIAILPALLPLLLPIWLALAGLLAWPIEKAISEMYFRDARRKLLSMNGLIRIGITGSYGKTSVKHILATMLGEKYLTFATPASFNTPMGVTKAIREKLTPSYQVFLGEMGARHVGDIKEMCRLVKPTLGVITSVGPQHLETFKTVERVASTKYELIEALPQDSHAFFFDDEGICLSLYEKTKKPKSLASFIPEKGDVWCDDISVSTEGSRFMLHVRGAGQIECHTMLLGRHNIQNILLASTVCHQLGLTLKQIAHGIAKLEPVKSRLELIKTPGSFTIINDAFNSNPRGAKAALEVLAQFPKRRIIITPGMVELGDNEAQFNYEFGKQIAGSADIAIVVGKKRAEPILKGITDGGMPKEQIHRVDTLEESTKLLHQLALPTDTVLYENDLPDNYQEA